MNKLRRFLSIGVMVMTIFATVGACVPTSQAAASAGDLIKMDGLSSVYYLGSDGKRYVFPNEATYMSWYNDFSGVVTIPASELQSYPLGGNVTMRPGTKLVKITTDPSVYAVEPNGVLRKIQSEAQAAALYGSNWNKRIVDLADAFFTNYTISSPLPSGSIPAGSLVKSASAATVYYYDGSSYRAIADESVFNANRFQFSNVLTVSSIAATGTAVSTAEFVNVAQNGASTGVVVTGSGLMVSLNAATPAAASVPDNGTRIPFAKYNLTAANDGAVTLNSITVTRTGLSDASVFTKVWAEKDGVRVTSQKTISSNDEAILTFSPVLTINAGQTVTIEIFASVSNAGGNAALSIASASAVSATAASITGSFPVTGNLMSFTNYSVAQVKFDGGDGTKAPKVGDTKADLGSFNLSFATTSKDVIFKSVTLRNGGSEDLAKSLSNLYLEKNGTAISGNAVIDGRLATFTVNGSGLLIEKGDSVTFKVRGDVMAKENTSTSTAFSLNKIEDIDIVESSTGFGVEIIPVDLDMEEVTIAAGAISTTKKSTKNQPHPADTEVVIGSKGVTSLIANVRADEAISADGLKINYTGASSTHFENIKVYVNGVLLGDFDPTGDTATATIDSSVTFNRGDNEVKVTVDVKSTAVAGDNIKISIAATNFLAGMNPEYVASGNAVTTINGSPEGAKITVQDASLSVAINDGLPNTGNKIVKGSKDVLLAKYNVKALYDTVRVNSITLNANESTNNPRIPDSSVGDIKLYVNGTLLATRDFNGGVTFSSLNKSIAKDEIVSVEIRGDFDTAATGYLKTAINIFGEDSRGKEVKSQNNATVDHEIIDSGSLSVTLGADTRATSTVVAKAGVEQEIAQYRLTATNANANITELVISNDKAVDARISEYRLYDGSTLLATDNPMTGTTTFKIASGNLVVPANGNKTLTVKAVLNPISLKTQTGAQLQLTLTGYKYVSAGTEVASSSLTVKPVSNTMTIRKTMPTFTLVSGVTGGQGTYQPVLTFTVSADANEDVIINKLTFTKSGSAAAQASTTKFYLYDGDSEKAKNEAANTANFTLDPNGLTIAKGTSKTLVVKANTTEIANDLNFGLSLENGGTNIEWGEYFVDGAATSTGANLSGFPLSGSTMKY